MIMIMKMAAPTIIPVTGSWLDVAPPAPTATPMMIARLRAWPQEILGLFGEGCSLMKTPLSFWFLLLTGLY
jgi:hypothetical protein